MQTHTKEALASLTAALALIGVIHSGIWFTMFGTPISWCWGSRSTTFG